MTDGLKEFLSRKNIKEALDKNDLKYCFDLLVKICWYSLISELNELLIKSEINPFDYIDKIYTVQFNGSKIENITIPKNIKIIDSYAFNNCTGLTSIIIPDSVTSIGEGAFYDCHGLESITIPDSVTKIGDWVFRNCTSLTSITIPNSVTGIGRGAFYNCTKLEDVTIPEIFEGRLSEIFGDRHSSINFKFI